MPARPPPAVFGSDMAARYHWHSHHASRDMVRASRVKSRLALRHTSAHVVNTIVERRDGTSIEFFDAGEFDADGRIATLLAFAGPLADVTG